MANRRKRCGGDQCESEIVVPVSAEVQLWRTSVCRLPLAQGSDGSVAWLEKLYALKDPRKE